MFHKLVICGLLALSLSGCASMVGGEEALAAANAAARDSAAAKSAAEAARAAADSSAQAASAAQSTADQALSTAIEAQAGVDASRESMERMFQQSMSESPTREAVVPKSQCNPDDESQICVWFGTNRLAVREAGIITNFSGQRDAKMSYGRATVMVPESHMFGETGSNWFVRVFTGEDDRLKVQKISVMSKTAFSTDIGNALKYREFGKRSAFIYIHGYNTEFEEALIRAAQIGTDLKIEGITAAFSWPSAGSIFAYTVDEATIGASEQHLEEFLRLILSNSEVDDINILAHSMGNRALLRVVERLAADTNLKPKAINQIILAAPDVDVALFKQLAKHYPQLSNRTTMYVSAEDRLLALSGIVHRFQRAGVGPPVTVVPGIDTVAVEEVDLSLLGHSYLAEAEAVLNDMYDLVRDNSGPADRVRLRKAFNADNQEYWFFR